MAASIGGKIRNTLVGILIALLVLAFAVWGVNDVFTPGANDAVISVGDTDVSSQEFEEDFTRELRRIAEERGEGLTNEQAYAQGLHNQILQRMVTDAVIAEDADDLGIGVNKRDARKYVEEIDVFKNELTGQFSETKLNDILRQNRITRDEFEADTLQQLRTQQTIPAIIGGIEAPAEFATRYYNFISEQRMATVLTLNENAIDPITDPDDEALKAYIDVNAASYMAPEYRQIIMIRLEPFDFTNDLTVTEEELQEAFDYRVELGEIGAPETRAVTVITAPTEEQATEAAMRMQGGEDPVLVAAALGVSTPDIFTEVRKDGLVEPASGQAAFEVGEGEAKAVQTSLGSWAAVYVPQINPAVVPDFDGAKDNLRETLLNEKAQEKIYDVTNDIEDGMTVGKTLEELADELNLTLSEYDFIDRTGRTQDDIQMSGFARIPGIAQDEEILRTAFTSDLGYETDLFETSNGGFAALRVQDIVDAQMKPFEEIKNEALAAWRLEQVTEAIQETAIEVQGEIRGGKSFEAVAAELGDGASLREVAMARANPPRDIGPRVVVGLLDADVGDLVRGAGIEPKTHQIGRLDKIQSNQDGLAGQFLDVLQERLTAELSSDIQTAYQQAVLAENPLREYPAQVRSTLGIDDAAE